jgi:hypothetical protein
MFQRAGDEFLGWDVAGLAGLEEPAMNLSRKCCSQFEEDIAVVLVCVLGGWYEMVLELITVGDGVVSLYGMCEC